MFTRGTLDWVYSLNPLICVYKANKTNCKTTFTTSGTAFELDGWATVLCAKNASIINQVLY